MKPAKKQRVERGRRLRSERLEPRYLLAGPYAPAAGLSGSTAIDKSDPGLVGWATAVASYVPGTNVDAIFQTPSKALGAATGTSDDTVSLGRGGSITLAFDHPIRDGLGYDFAVFENGVTDTFLELGFVEVSSDGTHFFRFENDSLTAAPVSAFGAVDTTNVNNLAGKYRQGFGTPFDLEPLRGVSPLLDTTRVSHVRIVDIVGDGNARDSRNRRIYDPYPTVGSAGFDLDAVGVLHQLDAGQDVISFEDVGASLGSGSAFIGPDPTGSTVLGPFDDVIVLGKFQSEALKFNNAYSEDYGSWNQWAYSNVTNNVTPGYTNQFGVITGAGGNGTRTFGIGFADQGDFFDPPTIVKSGEDIRKFSSLLVTNTTYAALSMRNGDSFAKKFGGASGNDQDHFLLTITGKDNAGQPIGSVDFYLADYRFADNTLDYIVDQWVEVDLSPIGRAKSLEFAVSSSDTGPFGVNTPAYFAVDEITMATPAIFLDLADREVNESAGATATIARVSRADRDTSTAVRVDLAAVAGSIASIPSTVTIPVGQPYVEFPIGVVNDDVVRGDRSIVIRATADGMLGSEQSLLIREDDQLTLSLTFNSQTLSEGGSATATVRRNDGDLSRPLNVQLTASEPSLFSYSGMLTIDAGKSAVTWTVNALEDQVDRPNLEVEFSAAAMGYLGGSDVITWLDNDSPKLTLVAESTNWGESLARPVADLEDLGRSLVPQSFDNGSDLAGGFTSQGLTFNNDYNPVYASWSGWSVSNTTDVTTPGYENQYSAIVGAGAAGSDSYAVAAAFAFPALPSIRRNPSTSTPFHSIEITNTTYAALSMRQGDGFAKKFGGNDGNDPDWLLLTIEGFNRDQQSIGTIDYYLADFRFADNALDYIVDEWTEVSLASLSNAVELRFSMSSSDVGEFGMNTPAYFAADNVVLVGDRLPPTVTVSRNTFDVSGELPVQLISSNANELRVPSPVVIPAGAASVTVPVEIVNDRLVDGTKIVQLMASAVSLSTSTLSVSVLDDDLPTVTLTLDRSEVNESGEVVHGVMHRNTADLASSLDLNLTADPIGNLQFPAVVSIPVGARSAAVTFSAIDNSFGDGDRVVKVDAMAAGFADGSDSVLIVDDELVLRLELDRTGLSESDAAATAMLEEIGAMLPPNSFQNGSDGTGEFLSGPVAFNNVYDGTYGSWEGWSVSNVTDRTTPGFMNQYSAVAGEGAHGSATYAVATAFPGGLVPTISMNEEPTLSSFDSIMVTNATYAALSMAEGDAFAKKFGGESGDDPDFFLLTIEGVRGSGESVGAIEFYLADFRFSDNALDYIVDKWTRIDLTSLQGAKELRFSLSSSDVGQFGMNTPAYFAADHVAVSSSNRNPVTATVHRSGMDTSAPLVVQLASDDDSEVHHPSSVTIPSGGSFVTFAIDSVDDAMVDGLQPVELSASAEGYLPATVSLSNQDNDVPTLTASVIQGAISESDGMASSTLFVHRNLGDRTSELTVQLEVDSVDTSLPTSAIIPAGSASVLIPFGALDNEVRDGDRVVNIRASAAGVAAGLVHVVILDDEASSLRLTQSDAKTSVSELLGEDELEVRLGVQPLSNVLVSIRSNSQDLAWSPAILTFTPDNWNQPQTIVVYGIPDLLIEGDEFDELSIEIDPNGSDSLFAAVEPVRVEVEVRDSNPSQLRIGESLTEVFLVDEESGVRILSKPLIEGIHVVGNDRAQTIRLDALTQTSGSVEVQVEGGDDTVMLRGHRFTVMDGGAGFDSLILNLQGAIDFGAFLDQRVVRFEQYVLASESGTRWLIDSGNLQSAASQDGSILVRMMQGQSIEFSSDAILVAPKMHGEEFAQVVELGGYQVVLITLTPWQNQRSPWDVNGNGEVTSLDALAVINEIARRDQAELPVIRSLEDSHGFYFDVSADGSVTALDALRVINEMARRRLIGESEWMPAIAGVSFDRRGQRAGYVADRVEIDSDLQTASKIVDATVARDPVTVHASDLELGPVPKAPDRTPTAEMIDAVFKNLEGL